MEKQPLVTKDTPLVGKAPQVKVILIKEDLNELQSLLEQKWKIAVAYQHAQGALFLLMKD